MVAEADIDVDFPLTDDALFHCQHYENNKSLLEQPIIALSEGHDLDELASDKSISC